jgi:hypothetical protein
VLDGEDAGAYDALYGHIRTAVAPRDVLEEIWARDVIDNLWETLRLRRLKVRFMRASAHEGLASLLRPLRNDILNFGLDRSLADRWAGRERAAINEVDGLLEQAGLDQEAIAAQTLARISHQTKCIGAANQRKVFLRETLTRTAGIPRCRQSVARRCLNLHPSRTGKWLRVSMEER